MKRVLFIFLLAAYTIQGLFPIKLQFGYGLNIQNLVLYLVLIALIFSDLSTRKVLHKDIPGIWLIIIGTSYVTINIMFSQFVSAFHYPLYEHIVLFKRAFFDVMIVYIIAFFLSENRKDAKTYLMIIVVSFAILNAYNLVIHFIRPNQISLKYSRFSGFGNSNKTAYLMCFLTPFLYYFYSIEKKIISKYFYLALICLTIITVALSGSRGGLLVLGLVLIPLIVIMRDFCASMVLIILLPAIILVFWDNPFFQNSISRWSQLSERSLEDASSNRYDIWRNIFQTFFSNPYYFFVGTGFETAIVIGKGTSAHNMYFKTLIELGIIGFIIFLSWLLRVLIFVFSNRIKEDNYRMILLTSFSVVLTGWLFTGLEGILPYISLTVGMALSYFSYLLKDNVTL